jgi:hypothetical protein
LLRNNAENWEVSKREIIHGLGFRKGFGLSLLLALRYKK